MHLQVFDMSRIHCLRLLLAVCTLACPGVSGLFEWLRQTQPPPTAAPPSPAAAAPAHLSKDAHFEMTTADEKFLTEAKQLELSPLDSCHHRVNISICTLKFKLPHSKVTFKCSMLIFTQVSSHSCVKTCKRCDYPLEKTLRHLRLNA